MKLSYFSYDFLACCCEAVNAGGWAGVFHRSGLLCVPVGGGPPASRPRRELRSARRLEARPGPATAHGHRSQAPGPSGALHTSGAGSLFGSSTRRLEARPGPYWDPVPRPQPSRPALTSHISEPTRNFARNSPTSLSNSEIRSLELQRFPTLLKLLLIELRATFPVTSPRHSPVPPTKPHKREKTRPAPLHQHPHAKKFALLASISVHTRNSSPSTAQTAQNQPIFASRANFFALMGAAATSHHPPTASPETDDTSARTKQPISGHSPPAKASPVSPLPDAMSTAQISRGVRKDSDAGGTLAT